MNVDAKLIKRCRRGEERAQSELYRRMHAPLLGICLRYASQRQDAVSLLNEGFLKILTRLDQYAPNKPFEAWCRRVMINTVIDRFRREKPYRENEAVTNFFDSPHGQQAVDFNRAEREFDAEAILQLVRALPPMQREVFNLYAIDGYKHAEIAKMLGIAEGTSRWHLKAARESLQHSLTQQSDALTPEVKS